MCVSNLIDNTGSQWNSVLLDQYIEETDASLIKTLHLSKVGTRDLLGWHYTQHGLYTVKSGYWLATHLPVMYNEVTPPPGSTELKKEVWKVNIPPKLHHFLWRILSSAVAIGSNLYNRRIITDRQCRRCCSQPETADHLFVQCIHAQAIWRAANLSHLTLKDSSATFEERLRAILTNYQRRDIPDYERYLPFWILWRIWKSRNLLVYQRRLTMWQSDLHKSTEDTNEWLAFGHHHNSVRTTVPQRISLSNWLPPPMGLIKVNYDCQFRHGHLGKAAWVLRDSSGFYIESNISKGRICGTVLEAELQALLMAIQHTWIRGFRDVVFEGDNKMVHNLVLGTKLDFHLHNWIRDINHWKAKFNNIQFRWTARTNNKVADCLVKSGFLNSSDFQSFHLVPACISNSLHENHHVIFTV